MSDPTFGLSITTVNDEPRPSVHSNMSIVGLVFTAPSADPAVFPLNTPVTFYSDETAKLAAMGTAGTGYDAVEGINQQLGEFQVAAQIIGVRCAEGASVAETIANLLGDINARTGMYALLDAPHELGLTPRLILVPGYNSQAAHWIDEITVTAAGTGFTSAPTVEFSGGGGGSGAAATATITKGVGTITIGDGGDNYTTAPTVVIAPPDLPGGVQATATATLTTGEVTAINVTNKGKGYSTAPAVTFTGGGGTGAAATAVLTGLVDKIEVTSRGTGYLSAPNVTLTGGVGTGATATAVLDDVSNAIVAGLPTLLDNLLGVAVVDGPSSTQTAALQWRESISSKRIIPVDPAYKVLDTDGSTVVVPSSPYVIGIAVRRDHEFQGRPFHSWANQAVRGIVGTARPIAFSLTDGANEGQTLLSQNIGVTVRGERTDQAIADGGYVFIGTDTCSDDVLWKFYNQVRGRDYIHLMFIRTLRARLGKSNITGHAIQAVLNDMEFGLRDIKATGDILGYRVGFSGSMNSPEQMRLGRFHVAFAAEEPAPLTYLGVQSARYRPALDTLLSDLLAQLDVIA